MGWLRCGVNEQIIRKRWGEMHVEADGEELKLRREVTVGREEVQGLT